MSLQSFLLRFIARSSDSLVSFVIALDAKLDTFLAQHDAEVTNLENQIEDLLDDAKAEAQRILNEAEDDVAAVREEITKAVNNAEVLARLKAVLTK